MKFSEAWLRTLTNPKIDSETLVSQLSLAGLEVDEAVPAAAEFSGVVIGYVVDKKQHPDADRLSVCQVDLGQGELVQIVCGAQNVDKDMKVPVATVGAILPGNFKIKSSKLRGELSNGMICSVSELGLAESSDGIMVLPKDAPIGQDIREYLQLNDQCIDVELTPNRGDCLSIVGLAREVAVINQSELTPPAIKTIQAQTDQQHSAKIHAPEAAPVYLTRVISGINNTIQTPLDLTEKLRRSGIRAINPVVDILNYVMLLLGQPMHGFDRDQLSGDINVRFAKAGEQIQLLNDQAVNLKENTLVIADSKNPLAIAGVMGSLASGVTERTQNIVLESAFFAPEHIAGKARQYGLHTDASHRFERGVDPTLAAQAIELATQMIIDLLGGQAGPVLSHISEAYIPKAISVDLSINAVERVLGIAVPADKINLILSALGLTLTQGNSGVMTWQVPSWRFDISLEVDLIEEIARILGYDNIQNTMLSSTACPSVAQNKTHTALYALKQQLTAQGFFEAITYSFGELSQQQLFADKAQDLYPLQNPISPELAVMRVSLIPGLLNALSYNLKRQQERVRLFESGHCFFKPASHSDTVADEKMHLAGVACGDVMPLHWQKAKAQGADFYQMKGAVTQLLSQFGCLDKVSFKPCTNRAYLHPGQSAEVFIKEQSIGVVGVLHPAVQKTFQLKQAVSVFELNLDAIQPKAKPVYQSLSKFPSVRRDIAIEVDQKVLAADIVATIQSAAQKYLQDVTVFDVYQSENIGKNKKSLAIALVFQAQDRTLEDTEIHAAVEKIIRSLHDKHNAELRE